MSGKEARMPQTRRFVLFLCGTAIVLGAAIVSLQIYLGRLEGRSAELEQALKGQRKNAPFIVSDSDVIDLMLELGEVDADDVVYDLGCGDGRILIIAATRFGCRGVGYEYDAQIAELARQRVKEAGVEHLVTIHQMDIFEIPHAELNEATVITLYLLDWMNRKLIPQLAALDAGKVIVSHDWGLGEIEPDRVERIQSLDDPNRQEHVIRAWRTPLDQSAGE